jgi:hypothetical protein
MEPLRKCLCDPDLDGEHRTHSAGRHPSGTTISTQFLNETKTPAKYRSSFSAHLERSRKLSKIDTALVFAINFVHQHVKLVLGGWCTKLCQAFSQRLHNHNVHGVDDRACAITGALARTEYDTSPLWSLSSMRNILRASDDFSPILPMTRRNTAFSRLPFTALSSARSVAFESFGTPNMSRCVACLE